MSSRLRGRLRARRVLVLLLALFALGCDEARTDAAPAASASGGETEKAPIAVGIAIPSYVHAVAWIAADRGEFAAAGLDPTVTVTGGSAAALRTLIAKQTDVVLAGGDAVLKAHRAGAELAIVGSFVERFYHRIVAPLAIATPADLKGKTIGLPFLGGPQDMAVRFGLEQHGLAYGEDVKVMGLGKELNRVAAMKQGQIQATTSQTPASKLKEMGIGVIIDPTKADAPFPYMVMAVRRDVLAERRAHIAAALGALCRASAFYRDASHRDESLAIIAKRTTGSDTQGARLERYQGAGPSFLKHPPTPDAKALETVGTLIDAPLKPDEAKALVEPSLLEELQAAGTCR